MLFNFSALAAPGGVNDIVAFCKTTLHSIIEDLPLGKYIVGDNANVCSENLITLFSGKEKKDKPKDTFNFYLSQLQIRVEITFGIFTNKWRLFKRPLQVKLKNAGCVFLYATQLNNFCIDESTRELESLRNGTEILRYFPSDVSVASIPGNSMMCDILVQDISAMALSRPSYNVSHNK